MNKIKKKQCIEGAKVEVQLKEGWIEGEIIGFPSVYMIGIYLKVGDKEIPMPNILSEKNAEERPPQSVVDKINKEFKEKKRLQNVSARIEKIPSNPKIRLADGKIVYGCQVWWKHKE